MSSPFPTRSDAVCGVVNFNHRVRCELPAGHEEAHRWSDGSRVLIWATDEQAERMRALMDDPELEL